MYHLCLVSGTEMNEISLNSADVCKPCVCSMNYCLNYVPMSQKETCLMFILFKNFPFPKIIIIIIENPTSVHERCNIINGMKKVLENTDQA